jgi:hypothetical protein
MLQKTLDPTRHVWIDALCIDQSNVTERSRQVALMRDIFARADLVHVFLSKIPPGTGTPNAAIPLLHRVGTLPRDAIRHGDRLLLARIDHAPLLDLVAAFHSPWWYRLWVVQEVTLARDARAHVGAQWIDFRVLLKGILAVYGLRAERDPPRALPWYMRQLALKFAAPMMAVAVGAGASPALCRISDVVHAVRGSMASVPHDRVYAILGLLPPELGVEPDYTKPLAQVYEEFFMAVVRYERSLDVLALAGLHDSRLFGPSWMPILTERTPFLFRGTSNFDADGSQNRDAEVQLVGEMNDQRELVVSALLLQPVDVALDLVPDGFDMQFLDRPEETRGMMSHSVRF